MDATKEKEHIPDYMFDKLTQTCYKKGRFFGKGGFAKCYEITDSKTNQIYAGKIVSKTLMSKHNQREKLSQEIMIHRSLDHKNVVGFHSFFEDDSNVYIVLELCTRRSMMELHKRRKALTEPEARYYMYHILQGVKYLHENMIIHRDLKLGNLFLSEKLEVKIGDFGLAAKVTNVYERKRTLCGTPNYIAPEILNKAGHSFEVDVWSIGCILYTLLVGSPPFETSSLKETYARIKRCDYRLPTSHRVSRPAAALIRRMLQADPKMRPTVRECLDSEFFASGLHPLHLPISSLTVAPRFDNAASKPVGVTTPTMKAPAERAVFRKPLTEMNCESPNSGNARRVTPRQSIAMAGARLPHRTFDHSCRQHLESLLKQLQAVLDKMPAAAPDRVYGDEASDPAAAPLVWISKWVDYSDKYGFGYLLSDEVLGVMFNDTTKLVLLADGQNVHFMNRDGSEFYHTMTVYPETLEKKMKLLLYFRRYMSEHLVKAGADAALRQNDDLSRTPYLFQWFRTATAVVMHLTNGTLQVNFTDHTKLIMCPHMSAVTWIGPDKSMRTFRFSNVAENGCSAQLASALRYSADKIRGILASQ